MVIDAGDFFVDDGLSVVLMFAMGYCKLFLMKIF